MDSVDGRQRRAKKAFASDPKGNTPVSQGPRFPRSGKWELNKEEQKPLEAQPFTQRPRGGC